MDTALKVPLSGGYPTRPDLTVLNDFSLLVELKQAVALVGGSGSGKSTVLCLLERSYDIQLAAAETGNRGSLTVDGLDIRDIDPRWLHSNMAIVSQEPSLFFGSIKSNIMYSRYASDPCASGELATMEEVVESG